jgi:c-di-GMP-related signal transduction protein
VHFFRSQIHIISFKQALVLVSKAKIKEFIPVIYCKDNTHCILRQKDNTLTVLFIKIIYCKDKIVILFVVK